MDIKEIAEWIFIADEDLKSAKFLNSSYNPNKEAVYYHCSQSIEKYLKGYLRYYDITFNYNHNLSELIKKCEEHNNIFKDIVTNCNNMNIITGKLRYPSRIDLDKNDVNFALNSAEKTKNIKPIQIIRDIIIKKFGENWQEPLFNAPKIEKKEPMSCFKYDKFPTKDLDKYLNTLNDFEKETDIYDKIIKYTFNDKDKNKIYLLKREHSNNITQLWYFDKDFNNTSAYEFIKQFDILETGNSEERFQ